MSFVDRMFENAFQPFNFDYKKILKFHENLLIPNISSGVAFIITFYVLSVMPT